MLYRVVAELVLVFHFGFVIFVALGGLLVLRWRSLVWLHLSGVAWGVLVQCADWTCPLTPLENWFRRAGGEAGYEGGFLEHYIRMILYPEHLTYSFRASLGVLLILVNAAVYSYLYMRSRKGRAFAN
ncbi:MAG TPA: DUF2784 domain-containing protein [Pyrinomonadaceae bacterium]|jgi:hypothetical protein|nr:DUF2784 domain-containing protein [Pyrinomonadaceae bacterium]